MLADVTGPAYKIPPRLWRRLLIGGKRWAIVVLHNQGASGADTFQRKISLVRVSPDSRTLAAPA